MGAIRPLRYYQLSDAAPLALGSPMPSSALLILANWPYGLLMPTNKRLHATWDVKLQNLSAKRSAPRTMT